MARVSAGISSFELSQSESIVVNRMSRPPPRSYWARAKRKHSRLPRQISANYNSRTLKTVGEFQEFSEVNISRSRLPNLRDSRRGTLPQFSRLSSTQLS